jgi:predicted lipase
VAFDDEFQQHELVYAIWVNRLHKRITVIFRGSTTQTDWATNYQVYMKLCRNMKKCYKNMYCLCYKSILGSRYVCGWYIG